jgi:hypothetical protein
MNQAKFYHVKADASIGGVVTFATRVRENDSHLLDVGVAFASPKDRFERQKGCQIAFGRMIHPRSKIVTTFSGHSADDITKLWNEGLIEKPTLWQNRTLINIEQNGLSFAQKV